MELRAPSYRLSFNGNPLLGFNCLGFLLRNIQLQDTILELTMNVIFGNAVTDIEATAHRTAVTLLADVVALLIGFILIKTLRCGNGQVTILQLTTKM